MALIPDWVVGDIFKKNGSTSKSIGTYDIVWLWSGWPTYNLLHSNHVFRIESIPYDLRNALLSDISPYLDLFFGGLCFVGMAWADVFGYDNCHQETSVTSGSSLSGQSKSSVQKQMSLKLFNRYSPQRRFCCTLHLCHRVLMISSTLQCSLSSFQSKKICCMSQFRMSTAGHRHRWKTPHTDEAVSWNHHRNEYLEHPRRMLIKRLGSLVPLQKNCT